MIHTKIWAWSVSLQKDRCGVAAVEMALLAPILVLLFLGVVEVTQLVRVKTKLALAGQAIQNMVAEQSSATATSLSTAFTGGQLVMMPFSGTVLTAAIASVSFDSSGNANAVSWQVVEGGATGMTTATACTLANQMSLGGDSVIIVSETYSYVPVLFYVLNKSYALTEVTFGRPRNVSSISAPASSTGPTGSC